MTRIQTEAELKLRLSRAKTALILEHPFVGTIAMSMPFSYDDTIQPPTACTNGKWVKFHPQFVSELNDEELKFVVAHEVMHPMLEHTTRRGSREHRRWNQAADYVINKFLNDEKIGKMPKMGLLSDAVYQAGGGTTDGIYETLPPNDMNGPGQGNGHGDPMDDCQDGGGSAAEVAQQAAEWKVKVAQAAQAAKMAGKLSANAQRLVGEILEAKVNWREAFQRFMIKAKTDQRSFARPNRRFTTQGLYMPSVSGEQMGEVVFFVDCSGSIGQEELNQFAGEMRTAKEDCNPLVTHVAYFDSQVCHYDKFTRDEELVVAMHGGGGTDFGACFKWLEQQDINPVAIVFLTDMYGPFGDTPPEAPLLWVSTSGIDKAPFGEVIMMHAKQGA